MIIADLTVLIRNVIAPKYFEAIPLGTAAK
jgi:hypothetical protein